jgi:hypothetical protein
MAYIMQQEHGQVKVGCCNAWCLWKVCTCDGAGSTQRGSTQRGSTQRGSNGLKRWQISSMAAADRT